MIKGQGRKNIEYGDISPISFLCSGDVFVLSAKMERIVIGGNPRLAAITHPRRCMRTLRTFFRADQ